MKPFWRGIVFALWFLGQTLRFALPAASGVTDGAPPWASWEQGQLINKSYDNSSLAYDAETPPATTHALSDPVGIGPTIPAYDSCSIFPNRVADSPRAQPLVLARFLAAEGGAGRLLRASCRYGLATEGSGPKGVGPLVEKRHRDVVSLATDWVIVNFAKSCNQVCQQNCQQRGCKSVGYRTGK